MTLTSVTLTSTPLQRTLRSAGCDFTQEIQYFCVSRSKFILLRSIHTKIVREVIWRRGRFGAVGTAIRRYLHHVQALSEEAVSALKISLFP